MKAEVADGGQVVELEVLAPEDGVGARLAGGARVQHVVQAQLAIVALLGRELAGLDDPQLQHVVHPPAVVLHARRVRSKHQVQSCRGASVGKTSRGDVDTGRRAWVKLLGQQGGLQDADVSRGTRGCTG